jgi:hypothetical protein
MWHLQNALPSRIAGLVGPEREKALQSYRAMANEALRLEAVFTAGKPLASTTSEGRRPYGTYPRRDAALLIPGAADDSSGGECSDDRSAAGGADERGQSSDDLADMLMLAANRLKGQGPRRPQGRATSGPRTRPQGGRSGFNPGSAATAPWKVLNIAREEWQKRMDARQCVGCGRTGHMYGQCPDRPDRRGKGEAR